jgi:hypothetical protein
VVVSISNDASVVMGLAVEVPVGGWVVDTFQLLAVSCSLQ